MVFSSSLYAAVPLQNADPFINTIDHDLQCTELCAVVGHTATALSAYNIITIIKGILKRPQRFEKHRHNNSISQQ